MICFIPSRKVIRERRLDNFALINLPKDYVACCSLGAAQFRRSRLLEAEVKLKFTQAFILQIEDQT
ncbi:MAG: hypothetical protein QOC96_1523 [Acidobacteriota bacterium]|jgi:hypothetical protein|nr:hypothetical protein [Acidobacteriota bacterium]